ncbi:MAG: hypothetical protein Q9M20_01995 [Mariprofundaceae bacterium]|nr:hypothetical protein [Mariprofundaceae bacterium]
MKLMNYCVAILAITLLAGCANRDTAPVASTATTITGSAVAGAVTGDVVVRTATGAQLTTAKVTGGKFLLALAASALANELDFAVTGTYVDEVSGKSVTLTAANPLALRTAKDHFAAGTTGKAPVTVGSTVIRQLVAHGGKTLLIASTDFYTAFGYKPDLAAAPFSPYSTTPTVATALDKAAAFRAGMFSQFATDLGLDAIGMPALATALAKDLEDGKLNGRDAFNAAVTINITGGSIDLYALEKTKPMLSRLQIATSKFSGSSKNIAAVTAPTSYPAVIYDAAGATKRVALSDGTTQINVTLKTANPTPFMPGFRNAHITHQVTLTNAATNAVIDVYAAGSPVIAVYQEPMMWMFSGHHHSTPIGGQTNTSASANGIYTLDTYYVMATAMANGVPMGLWEYTVKLVEAGGTTQTVTFHPKVGMTMGGDLYFSKGTNSADTWTNALGTQPREYRTWLHSAIANPAGGHDLIVFVSTVDMSMVNGAMSMSFLPVSPTLTVHGALNSGTGMRPAVTITKVTVEASVDNGTTWNVLSPVIGKTGQYTIIGLAGLNKGVQNTVHIRLMVDIGTGLTARVDAGGNNPVLKFKAP